MGQIYRVHGSTERILVVKWLWFNLKSGHGAIVENIVFNLSAKFNNIDSQMKKP